MLLFCPTNVGRSGILYPNAGLVLANGSMRYDIIHCGGTYTSMYTRNTTARNYDRSNIRNISILARIGPQSDDVNV
jgi:hypothetical protein